MQAQSDRVAVWQVDLAVPLAIESAAFGLLDAEEKTRAAAFRFPRHRRRFIARRAAYRTIFGDRLSCPPKAIVYEKGSGGKPAVKGLNFSTSHSGDMAMLAMCDSPVGADTERIRPEIVDAAMIDRVTTPAEKAAFATLSGADAMRAFFRLWARKEAILKADGVGLSVDPAELHIGLAEAGAGDLERAGPGGDIWYVRDIDLGGGRMSALALPQPDMVHAISAFRWPVPAQTS